MATIALGALGTLIGGPLGGAVGALLGRQVDAQIIGSPLREGARLTELAVSTSSYGQPIARHYGRVRAAGTVIWATDLKEHREVEGGGKGRPRSATYSYSVSLAVALSSRPIDRVGRIWADGNLLRGAGGDLKTGGTLRIYTGHADQDPDPLLEAELGTPCPAHRGCAYAVFEDLDLSDFGNRIPALSFEIFAQAGRRMLGAMMEDAGGAAQGAVEFRELEGFSHEGGSLADVAALVDRLHPIVADDRSGTLTLISAANRTDPVAVLPEPVSWPEGDFGREGGTARTWRSRRQRVPQALRYYDPARDYQPGLQRADGPAAASAATIFEFPGVLSASDARALVRQSVIRAGAAGDTMAWRMTELDPDIGPGAIVRAPGTPGLWRIAGWEWRPGGVELELQRHVAVDAAAPTSDPGTGWSPPDRLPQPSLLRVFELPWDGSGSSEARRVFAAISAPTGRWAGAALYADREGALVPTGLTARERAVGGLLDHALPPSPALMFEAAAQATITLWDSAAELVPTDIGGIARGANRLLVGGEVIQFAAAEPLGAGRWTVTGLLRGRGGTEAAAQLGHEAASSVTVIDDRLLCLEGEAWPEASTARFAAIGQANEQPSVASVEGSGLGRKPLMPVHPRRHDAPSGELMLTWIRRARGGWTWRDEVDVPLIEQDESYQVGLGPLAVPHRVWLATEPSFVLDAETRGALAAAYPGAPLWVRQCGSFALSDALLLGAID